MADKKTITRRAAFGSIATGLLLLGEQTFGFSSLRANRGTTVAAVDDDTAFLTIKGKTAEETPVFKNKLGTNMEVSLTAPDESSAEFDLDDDGTSVSEADFTLSAGESRTVSMNADTMEITVAVEATFNNGRITLQRDFEIPQSNQVDITPTVAASGGSGKFEFGLANRGSIDAVMKSIRVNGTSSDADRVAEKEIFVISESENNNENPRQLISSKLDIGQNEPLTGFNNDDSVTLATPAEGEEEGAEVIFEFNRFGRMKEKNDKFQFEKMSGESINITIEFSDSSTATFELNDGN